MPSGVPLPQLIRGQVDDQPTINPNIDAFDSSSHLLAQMQMPLGSLLPVSHAEKPGRGNSSTIKPNIDASGYSPKRKTPLDVLRLPPPQSGTKRLYHGDKGDQLNQLSGGIHLEGVDQGGPSKNWQEMMLCFTLWSLK